MREIVFVGSAGEDLRAFPEVARHRAVAKKTKRTAKADLDLASARYKAMRAGTAEGEGS